MLDRVFQFTDVARPSVGGERVQAVIIDTRDPPAMLFVRFLNEMLDQEGQVLDTRSIRRFKSVRPACCVREALGASRK
jgi:hypothetical protein